MDDLAELALEGTSTGVDHYEKVYHPIKNKAQNLPNPIKKLRGQSGSDQDQDQNENDYYESPRRSNTDQDRQGSARDRDGRSTNDRDRRGSTRDRDTRGGDDDYEYDLIRRTNTDRRGSRRNEYVEETYEKRSGRAKSAGRDGYYGSGGRGLHRDDRRRSHRKKVYSDSESSVSPSPHRRKSLGEKALVALGLGGVGAAAEKEFDEHRRDRYRSPSRRRRHRDSDRTYDRPREYRRDDRPRRAETFSDTASQTQRMPAGYLGSNVSERDLRVATRNNKNPSQSIVATRRPDTDYTSTRGSKRSSSSSSSESSSVCSSSEDERRTKKLKGREYLTAGLAAVATIHAAHGVYSSMEARDKRHLEVAKGELSPQEARKLHNKARIQDVAAVGIAALGIKSAYGEWKEVQENRHELGTQKAERQERHEKRLKKAEKEARRRRDGGGGGNRDGRDGQRRDGYGGRDGYRSA